MKISEQILREQQKTNMLLEHLVRANLAIMGTAADKGYHNLLKYANTAAFSRDFAKAYKDQMMQAGEDFATAFREDLKKFKDNNAL